MTRKRHLKWFQDAYSDALARNPKANFSFVGHSNGTYLFGESLRSIPGMRFDRAVLVGSVLPASYAWKERFAQKQLTALRVDGSAFDWPVGWLCRALRSIGMRDIGTGGFEGFEFDDAAKKEEFFWYNGGHGEPLNKANLPAIAEYAVTGGLVKPGRLRDKVPWWFSLVSRSLGLLTPLAALTVFGLVVWLAFTNPVLALLILATLVVVISILDVI
jgi:hypothetical protein